jgi:nucleoside-diphosphate-sugar epimerase
VDDLHILVIGALGQVGSSLTPTLRARYGGNNVVAASRRSEPGPVFRSQGPFELLDVVDRDALRRVIEKHRIDTIYHLAAIMSASGEANPSLAWEVNITGLRNVLDLSRECGIRRVFFPSSIAVFGKTTPRDNTPQHTVLEPTTMYGVSKVAGENLCNYYFNRWGLDIRSVRYPGLITARKFSGGGTSDYAVEIFFGAQKARRYTCFVGPQTVMPMMYMDDAVKATIAVMEAPSAALSVRTSYNISALSFTAAELAAEIKKFIPAFECYYVPDFRQAIADSWPNSIDDSMARQDWGWSPDYGLNRLTKAMLEAIDTSH